jgi:hypothetical protein
MNRRGANPLNPRTTIVGGIGHRDLEALEEIPYVQICFYRLLAELMSRRPGLRAVSALAAGADTIFAQCAKSLSIPLQSVIPFANFDADFVQPEANARYRSLRNAAVSEHRINFSERDERAYKKSMEWVVFSSTVVIAAWDGRRAGSIGGTWEAVSLCQKMGKSVIHVNTADKTLSLYDGSRSLSAIQKDTTISQIIRRL